MTTGQARKGFDLDLRDGQLVEHELLAILLDKTRVEVKWQDVARTHLFIERDSRGRESGLTTTEADWWVIVYADATKMLWLRTETLRRIVAGRPTTRGGDFDTSVGWAVPISELARGLA